MDPTTLRNALGFLRRQWWVIAQAMVVVGSLTAFLATREAEPLFGATASVVVTPEGKVTDSVFPKTPVSILNAEVRFIGSTAVIDAAAATSKVPAVTIQSSYSTGFDTSTGTIFIRARSVDAEQAVIIANALAESYVSVRIDGETTKVRNEGDRLDAEMASMTAEIESVKQQLETEGVALPSASSPATPGATTTTIAALTSEQQKLIGEYTALTLRYQQTSAARLQNRIDALLPNSIVAVDQLASAAVQPAKQSPARQGLLGVIIGMVVGGGIAVLRELLDDRVHSRDDVEKSSGKPVIAELPYDSASASTRRNAAVSLASIARPHEPLAEAIRQLRTAVSFLAVDKPITCITVTSAEPDEGKSLVAANLAVAFAQAGVDTILLSGDLRRPSLDARMLPADARGFSDLIMARVDLGPGGAVAAVSGLSDGVSNPVSVDEVVFRTQLPGLRFVPVGTVPPNPAELLASKAAVAALDELRSRCEMLVIDSPPTLVTDGVILADLADATVLVAAMSQSHKSRVAAASEALSGGRVRVLGVVLNKVSARGLGYQSYTPVSSTKAKRSGRRGRADSLVINETKTDVVPVAPSPPPAPVPIIDLTTPTAVPKPTVIRTATVSVPRPIEDLVPSVRTAIIPAPQPAPAASPTGPTFHEPVAGNDTMQRPMTPVPQTVPRAPLPAILDTTTLHRPPVTTPAPRRIPAPPVTRSAVPPPPPPPSHPNGKNGTNGNHTNGSNGTNGTRIPAEPTQGRAASTEDGPR